MADMTLSDYSRAIRKHLSGVGNPSIKDSFMEQMADAIDAHLAGMGETSVASDLVEEGLTHFYKNGDACDKEYVSAIRAHIARLTFLAAPSAQVSMTSEQVRDSLRRAVEPKLAPHDFPHRDADGWDHVECARFKN